MDLRESLRWLDGLERFGMRLGLEATERLLGFLGDPHRSFRSIHVTGTNGKGSVCAYAGSILREAGQRVGVYTSPHVERFNERIVVGGEPIADAALLKSLDEIRSACQRVESATGHHPTYFEATTALALLHFADAAVQTAVVEVGLGGRLDATNVLTPEVACVTRVALDHTEILGSTTREIAIEKVAIIKGGTAVLGPLDAPPAAVAIERCTAVGAKFLRYGHEIGTTPSAASLDSVRAGIRIGQRHLAEVRLGLVGVEQPANAALAAAAVAALVQVTDRQVRDGLGRAHLPGRFEAVQEEPTVILDGAHNPDAARHLAATLDWVLPGRSYQLVAGMLNDKDAAGFLAPLLARAASFTATAPGGPRARPAADLAGFSPKGRLPVRVAPSLTEAMDHALASAGRTGVVVVTGSFYTIGGIRARFRPGSGVRGVPVESNEGRKKG